MHTADQINAKAAELRKYRERVYADSDDSDARRAYYRTLRDWRFMVVDNYKIISSATRATVIAALIEFGDRDEKNH